MAITRIKRTAPTRRKRRKSSKNSKKALVRYRTKTVQVTKKVLNRAKIEAIKDKEGITAVAVSGLMGFFENKLPMQKAPKILQKLGAPMTMGLAGAVIYKMSKNPQLKKWAYSFGVAGLSIGAYEQGKKFAGKTVSGMLDIDDDYDFEE